MTIKSNGSNINKEDIEKKLEGIQIGQDEGSVLDGTIGNTFR